MHLMCFYIFHDLIAQFLKEPVSIPQFVYPFTYDCESWLLPVLAVRTKAAVAICVHILYGHEFSTALKKYQEA